MEAVIALPAGVELHSLWSIVAFAAGNGGQLVNVDPAPVIA